MTTFFAPFCRLPCRNPSFSPLRSPLSCPTCLLPPPPPLRFAQFKAATRTNGKSDHAFVLDRTVAVGGGALASTAAYGNIKYGSKDGTRGGWRTDASVGLEQRLVTGGFKWAVRGGVTSAGDFVYDLML